MVAAASPLPAVGINLCVGGYDGSVAGLHLCSDADNLLSLTARFAYAAHINAVRCAAFLGPTLVTGGTDETIRVYDLARGVERGALFQHTGTVNALAFASDARRDLLLSGADDAALCVWRVADWRCLKKLTGHQAAVLDVAMHPTARVALSVAKDRSLFMWNMLKGRVAFSAKTKEAAATVVEWSPRGGKYLLAAGRTVTMSTVEGRSMSSFAHEGTVLAAAFVDEDRVATGGEEKVVRLWDVRTPRESVVAYRHGARVRDVCFVGSLLMSADSGGGVKIWDVRAGGGLRLETSVGGGDMRLTCLAAASAAKSEPHHAEEEVKSMDGPAVKQKTKRKERRGRSGEDRTDSDAENKVVLEGTASQRKRKKRRKGAQI